MSDEWMSAFDTIIRNYRVHLLIAIIAFFLAITFAHPSLFVTDEWITVNQLSQLHEGHQILINEGKYGYFENGTPAPYFILRQNYLAYPLMHPIISLPAYGLIDILGNHFAFAIVYLWTFLLIVLALFLNTYFPQWTSIRSWRWTNGLIGLSFLILFINLYFYQPLPLSGKTDYPEIIAIVFTHILLYAILAVMIYEICRIIFKDIGFAFFASLVCLSCSSAFFWTNFCKDHLLTIFLVTLIIVLLMKLLEAMNPWYLMGAFAGTGVLAWVRPELALAIAVTLCLFTGYLLLYAKDLTATIKDRRALIISPLFTFIGAIPFFINNLIVSGNFLVPVSARYYVGPSSGTGIPAATGSILQNSSGSGSSILDLAQIGINIKPSTIPLDFFGVFFYPQNGSMGVIPLVPVFLIAILLVPFLILNNNLTVSPRERHILIMLILISIGVFLTYAKGITGMNTSLGIVPDMRYLSPMYLPLALIGLCIVRKIPGLTDNPKELIRGIIISWIILVPLSLVIIAKTFPPVGEQWMVINFLLNTYSSIALYLVSALVVVGIIYCSFNPRSMTIVPYLFALACALPLVWQIDSSFVARLYGIGLGGFGFWIPVVLKGFVLIFGSDVTIQNLLM